MLMPKNIHEVMISNAASFKKFFLILVYVSLFWIYNELAIYINCFHFYSLVLKYMHIYFVYSIAFKASYWLESFSFLSYILSST